MPGVSHLEIVMETDELNFLTIFNYAGYPHIPYPLHTNTILILWKLCIHYLHTLCLRCSKPWLIMVKILPIMLLSSAQKSYPLYSMLCPQLLLLCHSSYAILSF